MSLKHFLDLMSSSQRALEVAIMTAHNQTFDILYRTEDEGPQALVLGNVATHLHIVSVLPLLPSLPFGPLISQPDHNRNTE